jgi:hypothetical protein
LAWRSRALGWVKFVYACFNHASKNSVIPGAQVGEVAAFAALDLYFCAWHGGGFEQ